MYLDLRMFKYLYWEKKQNTEEDNEEYIYIYMCVENL